MSPTLGAAKTQEMLPVIDKSQSDSGSYDNVLEFLYHGSERSLPECMLMMIPEPWQVCVCIVFLSDCQGV